jgi:DUF1680 family protein
LVLLSSHCLAFADDIAPVAVPVRPFGVREVKLLDGPFRHAMELDAAILRSIGSDRLLSLYRKEAGLMPKAAAYGGWESQGIAGHSLGHYLSACARMYHAAEDREFLRRVKYIVQELAACQDAGGDGYLGAIPRGRKVFEEISRGEIRSAGFDLNGAWVPWYTLHKLFAGLIDAHRLCGNEQAKELAIRLADWADRTTSQLSPQQWQQMLACEFGGMNESLAELYAMTREPRFLTLAKKFHHGAILDPLAAQRDELEGKHANTQIPKIIGVERIWQLTDDDSYAAIAPFFWQTTIERHTYVNGGNSFGEHFGPPGKLNDRLGANTSETCNTYNMLKLAALLFAREPKTEYADYSERALWNHILASQHPDTGMVCYYVPLNAGAKKPFQAAEAFTCCSGTGMENHARYGEYIYAQGEDTLYVNQFIASRLDWSERGVKLELTSALPQRGRVGIKISTAAPQRFCLSVRHPSWVLQGFRIRVNGKEQVSDSSPSSYAQIDRTWHEGDEVEIEMPAKIRREAMPDNPNRVAMFYGPILLAGVLEGQSQQQPPVLVAEDHENQMAQWLKQEATDPAHFVTSSVARPADVRVRPFFAISESPYIVYWDLFTESQWDERKTEFDRQRRLEKELEARTIDHFVIGEMQPERDHDVQGERTGAGEFGGRKFRHAWDGGWFSFDVKLPKDEPVDLVITYWGSESGDRTFDVLLDDHKLATQSLHQDKSEQFWDRVYPLPVVETTGKDKATIKLQAHPRNYAGGIFGVRVVRRDNSTTDGEP